MYSAHGTSADSIQRFNAVNFDGINDIASRGANLTGISSGKAGTISFWMNMTDTTDGMRIVRGFGATEYFTILKRASGGGSTIAVFGRNSANGIVLLIDSTTVIDNTSGWTHFLASWDLASGYGELYVNDVDDQDLSQQILTNDFVDFTDCTDWVIGGTSGPTPQWKGDVAELWFTTTQIDITVASNRRKFITTNGDPANLGYNGNKPTGTQPLLYLKGNASVWNAGTNYGSGGNFTMTGAVTNSTKEPIHT